MNLRRSTSWLSSSTLALAFLVLTSSGSAFGQYFVQPAPARYNNQASQPRYAQRGTIFQPRRGSYYNQVFPYNRTPYTDDWSTARHLPFPKPWMLPTRDPADRGR
jgi:hypothetical protein